MSVGDDLIYFRGSVGFRVTFEVQADNSSWVDFNTRFPSSAKDYWACLRKNPTIETSAEDVPGVYVTRLSSVSVTNRKGWAGKPYGFWRAPCSKSTPLSIHRLNSGGSFTTYSFSGWRNRKVRIGVDVFSADGYLVGNSVRGYFRIKNVIMRGDIATIELATYNFPMTKKSAATIKNGADSYRNLGIAALMKLLVKHSDPQMNVLVDSPIDFGLLPLPRTSSWGACPGVLQDDTLSIHHWIPRVVEPDQQNDTDAFVGFEVPGSMPRSGGGLGIFNAVTGRWTVLFGPDNSLLEEGWVISIIAPSSGAKVFAVQVRERAPNGSSKDGFYEIRVLETDRTGSYLQANGSWTPYWPSRWSIRKGIYNDASGTKVWWTGFWSGQYRGEQVVVPFPQCIDILSDYTYPGTRVLNVPPYDDRATWHGLTQKDNTDIDEYTGFEISVPAGLYGMLVGTNSSAVAGDFRFWMTDCWSQPILYEEGGIYYTVVVCITPGTYNFSIRRTKCSDGTVQIWSLNLGGTIPLYDRQITAWAIYPGLTSPSNKLIVAATHWGDVAQASVPPLSDTLLYEIDLTDLVPPLVAVPTTRFTNSPSDSQEPPDCISIVGIFTPWKTGQFRKQTAGYSVMTILSRGNISGGAYGLGIFKASGNTFILRFRDSATDNYQGPISSRPFTNFLSDPDDENIFYFTDKATGQMKKAIVDLTANTVVFTTENDAFPAHASELDIATVQGAVLKPDSVDSQPRYLFAAAPGPHGDVLSAYWERTTTSLSRRQIGLYPLVMLSRVVADSIDTADFKDKCWKEMVSLARLAPKYRLVLDNAGVLHFKKRVPDSGTVPKLVSRQSVGVPKIESGEYALDSIDEVQTLFDETVSSCVVTPWTPLSGDVSVKDVHNQGSKFAGKIVVSSRTERKAQIAVTCAVGGDPLQRPDPSQNASLLWRWTRVMETISAHLAIACSDTDVSIQVAGLKMQSDGRVTAGEQIIRVGDFVQVLDGTRAVINSFGGGGPNYVVINMSSPTDVNAQSYSEVTIVPQLVGSASDGEKGVTGISTLFAVGDTTLYVNDSSQIKTGMVLLIVNTTTKRQEYLKVRGVNDDAIYVERAAFGSIEKQFSYGTATHVKAFVSTAEVGKLYDVGDTGLMIGLELDSNMSAESRSVSPGDGVIATLEGFTLKQMDYAKVRRTNSASEDEAGDNETAIDDNRFITPLFAEVVSQSVVDEYSEPRIGASCSMPFWPAIEVGGTVRMDDESVIPEGAGEQRLEVVGLQDDLDAWRMKIRLRTFDAVAGSGARPAAEPDAAVVVKEGERRR